VRGAGRWGLGCRRAVPPGSTTHPVLLRTCNFSTLPPQPSLPAGVAPSQIGIITPYEGQRAHVVTTMTRSGPLRQALYAEIECASVDSFQVRAGACMLLWAHACAKANGGQGMWERVVGGTRQ